jgi:hypothetical protein
MLYVLALFEAALCVLATLGQMIGAGTALYLIPGFGIAALFITAGAAVRRGRRWGLVALLVLDGVRLSGFLLSAGLGLLPWVELPVTGATVVDGLLLPATVVTLSAWQLAATPIQSSPAPIEPTLVETSGGTA